MTAVVNESALTPFDPTFERERLRLVCLRYTGDANVAEDLAQDAVLIALRRTARDAPPRDWSPYLFGIARKLCAAWRTRRGQNDARFASLDTNGVALPLALADVSAPDPLESLLAGERERLVESALSALKPLAREALVARYIHNLPFREIAERWGTTENAATVRVHRGLDALRNVLSTTLRPEAAAHGLLSEEAADGWRETALFCCRCGRERLQGRFVPGADFVLRCPSCVGMLSGMTSHAAPMDTGAVLSGVSGFRAGLNRVNRWWQGYLRDALATHAVPCPRCNTGASVSISDTPESPGFGVWCDTCRDWTFYIHPTGLLYHSAETHDFWRRYPRMKNEPSRDIVCEGRPAILTAFADRATAARIEMVFDVETMRRMRVDATP